MQDMSVICYKDCLCPKTFITVDLTTLKFPPQNSFLPSSADCSTVHHHRSHSRWLAAAVTAEPLALLVPSLHEGARRRADRRDSQLLDHCPRDQDWGSCL